MDFSNFIYVKNYRISLISKFAIRIEKDDNKEFCDYKTQFAFNRNYKLNNPEFELTENDNSFSLKIYVDKKRFYTVTIKDNFEDSHIIFSDKPHEKHLLKDNTSINGTYDTVDRMDGEELVTGEPNTYFKGLVTKTGYFVLHDEESYLLDDNLTVLNKRNNDEIDCYLFISYYSIDEMFKGYFEISNFPPLLPRFVFGNWYSRFYPYTDKEYIYLMDKFDEDDIPFTVAIIDMDWHYSWTNNHNIYDDTGISEEEFFQKGEDGRFHYIPSNYRDEIKDENWRYGWTGYTFNKKLFPNPKEFLSELKKRNLAVGLNLHPADGVAFYEDCYKKFADSLNFDTTNKESIRFDFTDKNYVDKYFENVLDPFINDGVNFWWVDWQQGPNSNYPGLTPLWICNHYFYQNSLKHLDKGLILSRFSSYGGHRYPLGFSGDAYITFKSLKYLIKMTLGASDCGFPYFSHDIGGHMFGEKDGDLYLKFVQFGIFSPVNRLHCTCSDILSKETKIYRGGYENLLNDCLRLRHRMIPYIYSYSYRTTNEGRSLIRPIYYENLASYSEEKYMYEYIFADNLLVAPFFDREKHDGNSRMVEFFDAKGYDSYFDITYGYKYKADKTVKIYRDRGDLPVFIKNGGYFILNGEKHTGNSLKNPSIYKAITTFGDGNYTIIEDNDDKSTSTLVFESNADTKKDVLTVSVENNTDEDKTIKYSFLDIFKIKEIKFENCTGIYHLEGENLEVEVKVGSNEKSSVTINISKFASELEEVIFYLKRRMKYIDDDNEARNNLYYSLDKSQSFSNLVKLIKQSLLKSTNKLKLFEIIKGIK